MKVDLKSWWPLLSSALLAAGLIWLFDAPVETQRALAAENRPIELASALFYFAAMVLAAYGVTHASGVLRGYLALWALLCFLFFGEETSWLQHFLHYPTPTWMAQENVRGEFNLHNLRSLHGGELLGGAFQWRALFKAQNLFNLGFLAYFFGLPLVSLSAEGGRLLSRLSIPYPGRRLVAFAFIPLAVSAALTLLAYTNETKVAIAESREMICALIVLVFVGLTTKAALGGRV